MPKILELAEEMHAAFYADDNQISFEARKRGNSGYFLSKFLECKHNERKTGTGDSMNVTVSAGMNRDVQSRQIRESGI